MNSFNLCRANCVTVVCVSVAPVIDDANVVDNPKITVNRTILLECPVDGIPPPRVSWLKDGKEFLPRPGVRFLSQGRQVEIARAQLTDTAKYTCIATNEAGEVRKNYDLEVLGRYCLNIRPIHVRTAY